MEFIDYMMKTPIATLGAIWIGLLPSLLYGLFYLFSDGAQSGKSTNYLRSLALVQLILMSASLIVYFAFSELAVLYKYAGWYSATALVIGLIICALDYFSDDHKFPRYTFSFGHFVAAVIMVLPLLFMLLPIYGLVNVILKEMKANKNSEKEVIVKNTYLNQGQSRNITSDDRNELASENDSLISLYSQVLRDTSDPEERRVITDYLKTLSSKN